MTYKLTLGYRISVPSGIEPYPLEDLTKLINGLLRSE